MATVFPLTPAPSHYATTNSAVPHNVYLVGGSTQPSITLSQAGATAYTVRDYYGNIVSSGAVAGTTVTPTPPLGGWPLGWYRIYLTGPNTDSLFGSSYGAINFCVIRDDARFPAIPAHKVSGGEVRDICTKGVMGIGTSRLTIGNADAPTTGPDTIAVVQGDVLDSATYWSVPPGNAYYDAARPRSLWTNFPNRAYDFVAVGGLRVYCKDGTIDGSTVTVTATAGTSTGTKLAVNGETYDNLASASAAATALAASALVRGFGTGTVPVTAAQTIGNAYYNGVKSVVATLYPSVTRFEGPVNEPAMNAETAHQMRLFQAAVHAGHPSALAIGPTPVDINPANFEPFFAAGGGAWCDEISFHAYNSQTNGDINIGRAQIGLFLAMLARYGLQSKPLWQTESTHVWLTVYGVYHPRRARVALMQTLQWEQYGVPRERNSYWYDVAHFWGYPSFWESGDRSLAPMAPMYRVLAEETFGKVHASAISFGTLGDKLFLGSIYAAPGGSSVAVVVAESYMPSSSVTFTVSGLSGSTLTASDAFGNTSALTVTSGRVTLPVTDIPTYLRLPAGVTVTVHHCNDWPAATGSWLPVTHGQVAITGTVTPAHLVIDGNWQKQYIGQPGDAARGTTIPDTCTLTWPTAARLDRVVIWSGLVWQEESTLVDFDVQTSVDGSTWVTQTAVTRPTPTSFLHGTDARGTGTQRETYWDEQWVFDVKLPVPVTCKAVRINARATSYGGEPDLASRDANGQGSLVQHLTFQEIVVLCDDNTRKQYVRF